MEEVNCLFRTYPKTCARDFLGRLRNVDHKIWSNCATHLTPSFVTVQVLFVLSDLGEDVPVELEGEAAVLANLDLLRLQGILQMKEAFFINFSSLTENG